MIYSRYINHINKILSYGFVKKKFNMQPQPIQSQFQIIQKKKINHDCYIYYLKWAGPKFKLTIGQHFRIVQKIPTYQCAEGEQVIRKYTPISACSQQEPVQLLIKIYRPNNNLKFPHGGKLTPYLQKLQAGDKLHVDGPFGRFNYKPGGTVVIDGQQMKKKRLFFIAGGSGITPVYQTIREIYKMHDQTIEMILLFANKSQEDIVLRKQLEEMQPRLKINYILDFPPAEWKQFKGYVTKEVLEQICPLDDPDTAYIHCGPGPMNAMIRKIFQQNFPNMTLFKY